MLNRLSQPGPLAHFICATARVLGSMIGPVLQMGGGLRLRKVKDGATWLVKGARIEARCYEAME